MQGWGEVDIVPSVEDFWGDTVTERKHSLNVTGRVEGSA